MAESGLEELSNSLVWPRDIGYYYSCWTFASFTCVIVINHFLGQSLFEKLFTSYRDFTSQKKLEWNCRVSSTLHATLVTLLSLISLLFDTAQWTDPITTISRPGCIALAITVGYMLADTITMFTFQRGLELLLFCTHHVIVAVCFTFLLVHRIAPLYGIIRLTSEISTPFLNQRWFYRTIPDERAKEKSAQATLIFTGLFILGRYILPIPYWWIFFRHFNSRRHLALKPRFPTYTNYFISFPILLDVLNTAWGYPVFIVTKKALVTLGYLKSKAPQHSTSTHNGSVGESGGSIPQPLTNGRAHKAD